MLCLCDFLGGDGPKRVIIEEIREQHQLQERVFMLGTVDHCNVRNVCTELCALYMKIQQIMTF